jgi:hypothetical protein
VVDLCRGSVGGGVGVTSVQGDTMMALGLTAPAITWQCKHALLCCLALQSGLAGAELGTRRPPYRPHSRASAATSPDVSA